LSREPLFCLWNKAEGTYFITRFAPFFHFQNLVHEIDRESQLEPFLLVRED